MVLFLIVLLLSPIQTEESDSSLLKAVELYWKSLEKADYAAVLHLIHPDDLNAFIKRPKAQIQSWRLLTTMPANNGVRTVQVETRTLGPVGESTVTVKQRWERIDKQWKLRVAANHQREDFLRSSLWNSKPLPPELNVAPELIKVFQVNSARTGHFSIKNGLDSAVRLLSVEVDTRKFEVVKAPQEVAPRSSETVIIRFIGSETEQNLESRLIVRLEEAGQAKEFPLTLVYNYSDAGTEWLLKDAPAEVERMNQDPKVTVPKRPPPAPTPPPQG